MNKNWLSRTFKTRLFIFSVKNMYKVILFVTFSILIGAAILAYPNIDFENDGVLGFTGVLIGSLLTGLLTLIANMVIFKNQSKIGEWKRKRATLYTPLYKDNKTFISYYKGNIYTKNPCTSRMNHTRDSVIIREWENIKSDERYLEVNSEVKEGMDEITSLLDKSQVLTSKFKNASVEIIEDKLKNGLSKKINIKKRDIKFRDYIKYSSLTSLILGTCPYYEITSVVSSFNGNPWESTMDYLSTEEQEVIFKAIRKEILSNINTIRFIENRELILAKLTDVNIAIEEIILFINTQTEGVLRI